MPKEILMPELAESVVEGEILKWLVEEGDYLKKDQPFVEVMTDKVTVELPSPYEGVLLKKLAKELHLSEDETKRAEAEIQKITDEFIAKADQLAEKKEQEILG